LIHLYRCKCWWECLGKEVFLSHNQIKSRRNQLQMSTVNKRVYCRMSTKQVYFHPPVPKPIVASRWAYCHTTGEDIHSHRCWNRLFHVIRSLHNRLHQCCVTLKHPCNEQLCSVNRIVTLYRTFWIFVKRLVIAFGVQYWGVIKCLGFIIIILYVFNTFYCDLLYYLCCSLNYGSAHYW